MTATPPSYQSPSPSPVPQLPPYLPALMGCKNVESYEWLDRIEEGTYGVVYKAKDRRTGNIQYGPYLYTYDNVCTCMQETLWH